MDEESLSLITKDTPLVGYSLFVDDLNRIDEFKADLEANGYVVNDQFQMGDVISEIDRPLNQTRYLISGVISLLLLIFMTLMQNRYFELRKKDMALLKVNGLSTKDILQILCHQLILGLLVVFILQFV